MDLPGLSPNSVKKLEDNSTELQGFKRGGKPGNAKPLARVPRACNACRKQKMRCEGADNPPCKRCRNANLDCLFEKPSRETLTGEAGLERIRVLENHVAEIRHGQDSIHAILADIQAHLHGRVQTRSPSQYPFPQPSPLTQDIQTSPSGGPHATPHSGSSLAHQNRPPYSHPGSMSSVPQPNHSFSPTEYHTQPPSSNFSGVSQYNSADTYSQGSLPSRFPSITTHSGNVSSVRYHHPNAPQQGPPKRPVNPSEDNDDDSSGDDDDDDDNGALPASGLVAPWEVLRSLADVATKRAAKENGDSANDSSRSRPRTPTPERHGGRPSKRRKIRHKDPPVRTFPDVVTKGIISSEDAKALFSIFYHGCSTFLPVFDPANDTFEALHERSPFVVNCICMIGAMVRDGGRKPSMIYNKIFEEVQAISCATLFSPVLKVEVVQAMILVSGWSDNGWLSGGHAVRMALELSLHKAWPILRRRIAMKQVDIQQDRELVIASRTWFCLYLFEHQLSYGTGRPAILKDDESIKDCRMFLMHPLCLEDDMRLVSTVELMALRERVQNQLSPVDEPVNEKDFEELRNADLSFHGWYATWDQAFSQKYEDAAFYRQSLQIQHLHAELYHNAIALRGINGPDDVQKMPSQQMELAIRSMRIAQQGLDITVNSPAYAEGMKYAVHYTHATATFAASFLLRLVQLFPKECDVSQIRSQVEHLTNLMSEVPGKIRYALTLQLMLKRSKRRKGSSKSSKIKDPNRSFPSAGESPDSAPSYSPTYEQSFVGTSQHPMHQHALPQTHQQMHGPGMGNMYPQQQVYAADAENIWRGFEATSNEQLPVWISDQSLGGNSFGQDGMNAFLLPNNYLPSAPPRIW